MKWIYNICLSAVIFKATEYYIPQEWKWFSLVAPLVTSSLIFYLQIAWKTAIGSVKSIIWVLLKIVILQAIITVPVEYIEGYYMLKKILLSLSWIVSSLIILSPKKFSLSPLKIIFYLVSFFSIKRLFKPNVNKTLEEIDNLGNNGKDFEEFIANVYINWGFDAVSTTTLRAQRNLPSTVLMRGGSGEQGVDVIVMFDSAKIINGVEYEGLLIQCKQYSSKVGNDAVQEIFTAVPMYSQHFNKKFRPVVITNNYFTPQAKDLAQSTGVHLMDREVLGNFVKEIKAPVKKVAIA